MTYYNAPYLDSSEHSVLNHAGIPGVGGGGGVDYRLDGLIAQAAGITVNSNSGVIDFTSWVATIPDSENNITYAAGVFTVANEGVYVFSLYGNWNVDDSVETQVRTVQLTPINIVNPAATSVYTWAQGRILLNEIVPSNANNAKKYFNLDTTAYLTDGDSFKIQVSNEDLTQDTTLEIITLNIVKLS